MKEKTLRVKIALLRLRLLSVLVALSAGQAFATNASIKNADSDLANPANWNSWSSMISSGGGIHVGKSGHYTLSADLEVNGIIDDTTGTRFYLDMNDGRTLTAKGYNRHAFGTNVGKNSQYWITGGTFFVPETYFTSASTNTAIISPQRNHDTLNNGYGVIFGAYNRAGDPNRTANVQVKVPEIRVGYGTDSWFVASNRAEVTVGALNIGKYARGVGNGVIIDSGAVVTITNMTALTIGESQTSVSNTLQISKGGSVSGIDRFSFSAWGRGNTIRLSGADTDLTFPYAAKLTMDGVGNTFEILDGARHALGTGGQGRIWMGNGKGYDRNTIRVAGQGSMLTTPGDNTLIGQYCSVSNGLILADGATFTCARLHIGYGGTAAQPSIGSYLRMTNGAVLTNTSDIVSVGWGNNGDGQPYTRDSRADISDSTVFCRNFYISHNTQAVNSAVCLDHSTLKASGSIDLCANGRDGLLDVKNGSTVTCANFYTGHATSEEDRTDLWAGSGATVRLTDSSIVSSGNFIFYGTNTTLVVDNGQITASEVQLPYFHTPDHDCKIEIRGRRAKIRGTGSYVSTGFRLGLRRDTRVTFVVPAGGYDEAPFQTDTARINFSLNAETGDTPVVFDLSECGDADFETVLVQTKSATAEIATTDKVKAKMRAALAAALPAGRRAKLTFTKNEIKLKYWSQKGLLLLFR